MKKSIMDVIVVGAGASGLMAAITAARKGAKVLILEHIDVPGKKILATGNGRCNFTNIEQGTWYYRSESPVFAMSSLRQFSERDAIAFFESIGILATEKNGYYYPRTMQASTIRNGLLKEIERLEISILYNVGIRRIEKKEDLFEFDTKSGSFFAKACILATGGKADSKTGSDGSGYIYAKQLGHTVTDTVPALVPLVSNASWLKAVKGVRQEANVSLYVNGELAASDWGEVQFTDYGISGIPVFQVSRFASKALFDKKEVTASIDFVPSMSKAGLSEWLAMQLHFYKSMGTMTDVLSGIVNYKIAEVLAAKLPFANQPFAELSSGQIFILAEAACKDLKSTVIQITDTKPFTQAQVTAGGVSTLEINQDSMESTLVSKLYFAGEIIDVDGACGGYNLQWAWSSGYVAGSHAAK